MGKALLWLDDVALPTGAWACSGHAAIVDESSHAWLAIACTAKMAACVTWMARLRRKARLQLTPQPCEPKGCGCRLEILQIKCSTSTQKETWKLVVVAV